MSRFAISARQRNKDNPQNYHRTTYAKQPQKITTQYEVFYEYVCTNKSIDKELLKEYMQFDWILIEKPKRFPNHLYMQYNQQ